MIRTNPRHFVLDYLSLFTSLGTLLCCALPSILVLLGLGATVASVLSSSPWLIALSHHKVAVFGIAGVLLGGNVAYSNAVAPRIEARFATCDPGDPGQPRACAPTRRLSRAVLWMSVGLYALGFTFAFVLGPLASPVN